MKRIESLDYLRGIMAVSIMLYHYSSSVLGTLGGEFLLGKLGAYAVSIFYILSGLSLTIVYQDKVNSLRDVCSFAVKRVFRIFPLFWLAVSTLLLLRLTYAYFGVQKFDVPLYKIFLNFTLLFGFIEPSAYLTTGAWSIGNEMVFYFILPFLFFASKRFPKALPASILISFVMGTFYAFVLLDRTIPLESQFNIYINPFNQLFLFMGGVAIGKYTHYLKPLLSVRKGYIVTIVSCFIFVFYPASGDKVQIVTGFERIVFSMSSLAFVFGVYWLNPTYKSSLAKLLRFLGEGCYSIYLLHPLVAIPVVFLASKVGLGKYFAYCLSFFLTLFVSWLTFRYLEKPMMDIGKVVVGKINPGQTLQRTLLTSQHQA